jgi:uncharacterized membrane protein
MKSYLVLLFIISLVFLCFPLILFYLAFYSGSLVFKNTANNHIEYFYLLFMFVGVVYSMIVTKYIFDRNLISLDYKKILLIIFKITIILYASFLLLNTVSRFSIYRSEAIDVVFFRQEIWQLSVFEIPRYAWSQHFSPILILLVPLFWIIKSGAFLMFTQASFVISGSIPLYLICKEKLRSQFLGLAIVLSYLAFGGLQFGYAYGFHEILFFTPLFFWTYYFFIKKHIKIYFLFILLCLAVKEEVSFIVIFWGLYLIYKKYYRYALGTILLGILWYILCFSVIFPHFNQGGGFGYWGQYSNIQNNGVFGIISFAFLHPFNFIKTLLNPKYKIDTIFHSFGNFSFISFLYPPSLIVVLPSLMEKLLSNDIAAKNGFHYSAAICAVVLISVIESISSIQRKAIFEKLIKNINVFIGIIIIYVSISANVLYGYHPISPLFLGKEPGLSASQVDFLNHVIDSIPFDTNIASQYYIRSHIDRPYWQIEEGPKENETADYVIINTDLPLIMSEQQHFENNLNKLIKDKKYEIVINNYGTVLFKKKVE